MIPSSGRYQPARPASVKGTIEFGSITANLFTPATLSGTLLPSAIGTIYNATPPATSVSGPAITSSGFNLVIGEIIMYGAPPTAGSGTISFYDATTGTLIVNGTVQTLRFLDFMLRLQTNHGLLVTVTNGPNATLTATLQPMYIEPELQAQVGGVLNALLGTVTVHGPPNIPIAIYNNATLSTGIGQPSYSLGNVDVFAPAAYGLTGVMPVGAVLSRGDGPSGPTTIPPFTETVTATETDYAIFGTISSYCFYHT